MRREIATSQPTQRTGVLPSWFSFERWPGAKTMGASDSAAGPKQNCAA